MFKHYFEQVDGVAIYPIFSLVVFMVFFIMLTIWAFKVKKSYLDRMSDMPLSEDNSKKINLNGKHE